MLGVGEAPQATDTEEEGRRPPPPNYSVLRLGGEREERRGEREGARRCCTAVVKEGAHRGHGRTSRVGWGGATASNRMEPQMRRRRGAYFMCEARFAFWARKLVR